MNVDFPHFCFASFCYFLERSVLLQKQITSSVTIWLKTLAMIVTLVSLINVCGGQFPSSPVSESPRSYFSHCSHWCGMYYSIQNSLRKRPGKAFRRAKGLQIHSPREQILRTEDIASIYCKYFIFECYPDTGNGAKKKQSSTIINNEITVRMSKVNQISYQLDY